MINEFFRLNYPDKEYYHGLIYSITLIEINIIKYNKNKHIFIIINLLKIYINFSNTKIINDKKDINNSLVTNLRLIKNEIYFSPNIQVTTFHLKLIYIILILILISINNSSSELQNLISLHNKILLIINQYHKIIGSCFQNLFDIKIINIKNFFNLLQGPAYNITHITFQKIIHLFLKELFNDIYDENDNISQNSNNNFRARTLYQNDRSSEVSININTKNNNLLYNTSTHLLNNNYFLNDSFSKYSSHTISNISHRSFNNNIMQPYNKDTYSEKIRVPLRDNANINNNFYEKTSVNDINIKDDILSNKSSALCFKMNI